MNPVAIAKAQNLVDKAQTSIHTFWNKADNLETLCSPVFLKLFKFLQASVSLLCNSPVLIVYFKTSASSQSFFACLNKALALSSSILVLALSSCNLNKVFLSISFLVSLANTFISCQACVKLWSFTSATISACIFSIMIFF
jgi:hypothetical protein